MTKSQQRARLIVAAVLLCLYGAVSADDARLVSAEKAFQDKVAKAKATFDDAVKAARTELKAELEKAKLDATKAGDLEAAVAIKERIATIDDLDPAGIGPVTVKSLVGRYRVDYSNGVYREYVFNKDGTVTHARENGKPLPSNAERKVKVMWFREKTDSLGFILWGGGGNTPVMELVRAPRSGVISLVHCGATTQFAELKPIMP